MSRIHEHFVVRLKDEAAAAPIRARARAAFLALPGVEDWRTHRSTDPDRPTLFVETFTFADAPRARAAGARFSEMAETRALLGQIEEMIVGQHFTDVNEEETE